MGNSVSSEIGHRQNDVPGVEGPVAMQHAHDPSMPRQITVCLDGSAAVSRLQSKVPNLTSTDGLHHATTSGTADSDLLLREGQQKVLLWNCNPSDNGHKDQLYATAVDSSVGAAEGSVPAANKLTRSRVRGRKAAVGDSDMHPAVSSDVAGSPPGSSSNSSDSSFRGRISSIDETMPHGPDQSSDGEQDAACPQLTPRKVPQLPSRAQDDVREPAYEAGRLIIHSNSSATPDQVVWVLDKQQFLQTPLYSSSSCVMSPSFILPCAAGAARQSVTTEWCICITRLPGSSRAGCRFQLGLALRSAAAVCTSSGNPGCQAPGSPMQLTAGTAGTALEVYCMGRMYVRHSSGMQGTEAVNFESILQCGGQSLGSTVELPVALRIADSRLDIVAKGSQQHQYYQQQQEAGIPAALQTSNEEIHIIVDFSVTQLVQPNIAVATAASGSQPTTQQQQQRQHQQQDITRSDQSQDHVSIVPHGISDSATTAAAAPTRQLEAVLLSTSPRMLVVDGFFDAQMCDDLMCLAEGKLVRSRVASGSETPSRTSWSHFFVKEATKQALIVSAEAQIEALFKSEAVRGPFPPLSKVEALQVVKYHKGEFYHEHYDNRADSPLTRAATIIVYLCDTEEGGGTSFPRAVTGWTDKSDWQLPPQVTFGPGGQGIKVLPVQGRALVFWSKRADGSEDPSSIHAADTVIKGHKWIATRWMKDD